MFQECFLTYYESRCKNLAEYFLPASNYFDPDGVHDLRVEIKQLRSFFRLIEWIAPTFTVKKNIRNIRKLFKSAADLRDIHVQQILTREWSKELGVFLSEYYNTLKQKEFPARAEFATFAANFDLHDEIAVNQKRILKALEHLSDKDGTAKTRDRIEQLLQQIVEYGNANRLQEEHLHKLSILAKETRYTIQVAQKCFPELGYTEELDQQLRGLHQVLGKWHDTDIALGHIDDFLTEFQELFTEPKAISSADIKVYETLCKTLQEKKIDLLDMFEERWNEFIRFLKKQQIIF